ncbi:SGNH hydrolase-type esterase domain-containing protein [Flagelloscypha sp. PMI_526]|nr:SGNH hydrolase-type esterase domain-containing protein [Flagelloscypha sp. PMI_526]
MTLLSILLPFFVFGLEVSAVRKPKPRPRVILLGDSTVTDTAGWGAGFCADTKGLTDCINLSVSGTTSVNFIGNITWEETLEHCAEECTYATVQFGHNDQKEMTTDQFHANLTTFIHTIVDAGCKPILVTSLARRNFLDEHTPNDILGPYSAETIKVSEELGLPLLPLLADSLEYISKLGATESMRFNWDSATTNKDHTHLNSLGWAYFGRMVADEVHELIPEVSPFIVPNATLSQALEDGVILEPE